MMITLIAIHGDVKIYMTRYHGNRIDLYHYPSGEIWYGAKDARIINQFERSNEFETVMEELNNRYHEKSTVNNN